MSRRSTIARGSARLAAVAAAWLCVACATVPLEPLAFEPRVDGGVTARPLACARGTGPMPPSGAQSASLPGPQLSLLSWNLHKNADPGWEAALSGYAARSDLLLIQEAALTPALQALLGRSGHGYWILAGAWGMGGVEMGVLSSARVPPVEACMLRGTEPLLQLPKAALIARYAMQGAPELLAVANLHAVNFTLGLAEYEAQIDAVVAELAVHAGPMIVAGDFNTWSDGRYRTMLAAMQRLGLDAVLPREDARTRVFGRQIDHVFVRGFEVVQADSPQVQASDHNPLLATLRLIPR